MLRSIKTLVVCASFCVTAGLAAAHMLDEEPVAIMAVDGTGTTQFWCGAKCGDVWENAFTCQEGQSCCGWYWCDSYTYVGQCCNSGQYCNLTQKPYLYQCVATP